MSASKDLTGMTFGQLTVLEKVGSNKHKNVVWKCICSCQLSLPEEEKSYSYVTSGSLLSGNTKSCGCLRTKTIHSKYFQDLTGKKYGKLTVIGLTGKNKYGRYIWKCLCDCQINKPENQRQYYYTVSQPIKSGIVKSCGCYHKEIVSKTSKLKKKQNKYDLTNKYGIGYTSKNQKFYFDLEDYALIKEYYWHIDKDGYVKTNVPISKKTNKDCIKMHQLLHRIYYNESTNKVMDHINGKRNDNRKQNLREVTIKENNKNTKLPSNNKSGHKGVFQLTNRKWLAYITCNKKRYYLGTFTIKEDAINAREKAEKHFFGQYNRNKEDLNNGNYAKEIL